MVTEKKVLAKWRKIRLIGQHSDVQKGTLFRPIDSGHDCCIEQKVRKKVYGLKN